MARIDELFRYLKDKGGSDLHVVAGLEPRIRHHGHLVPVEGWPTLTDEALLSLLGEIASPERWVHFKQQHDLDFAYGLEGVARFRCNYFMQENGVGAVFRIIPERIVPLEELKLPPAVETFAHLEQGLVLVTGPTGSGKSTTLASIIDKINTTYAKHVVTIEDPVEFVHQNKKSTLSQREIGTDSANFASALRAAIRQDANVILVGEMRDLETIETAILAAETGHLVMSTLHTLDAAETVTRVISAFPDHQRGQARLILASILKGCVSQRLVPRADGLGMVPAV